MVERRTASRYQEEIPITFSSEEEKFPGTASCISETGMFILTRNPLRPGTPLKLILEIAIHERIYLAGVVIRTIKTGDDNIRDGMGIKLNETPFVFYNFLKKLRNT